MQNKFAEIITQIEKSKQNYQKSANEFQNLFKGVSQKAFRGELDLSKMTLKKEVKKSKKTSVTHKIVKKSTPIKKDLKSLIDLSKDKLTPHKETIYKLLKRGKLIQEFNEDKQIVLKSSL